MSSTPEQNMQDGESSRRTTGSVDPDSMSRIVFNVIFKLPAPIGESSRRTSAHIVPAQTVVPPRYFENLSVPTDECPYPSDTRMDRQTKYDTYWGLDSSEAEGGPSWKSRQVVELWDLFTTLKDIRVTRLRSAGSRLSKAMDPPEYLQSLQSVEKNLTKRYIPNPDEVSRSNLDELIEYCRTIGDELQSVKRMVSPPCSEPEDELGIESKSVDRVTSQPSSKPEEKLDYEDESESEDNFWPEEPDKWVINRLLDDVIAMSRRDGSGVKDGRSDVASR